MCCQGSREKVNTAVHCAVSVLAFVYLYPAQCSSASACLFVLIEAGGGGSKYNCGYIYNWMYSTG